MVTAPLTYQRVIITGASSGIGEQFAHTLAPLVKEIILTARRTDRLEALATDLQRQYPHVRIHVFSCNLMDIDALDGLIHQLSCLSPAPASTLLINNAGLGDYGEFSTAPWERIHAMLMVNMNALTKLCHHLLPSLLTNGGDIINISSLASSLPIPDFAVYAASKSYVLSLSEAIRMEVKAQGINVLAVCPGPVSTEFGQVARRPGFTGNMMPGKDSFCTTKEQVVAESLQAMLRRKARVYPGRRIKPIALLLSLLPMGIIRMIMGRRPRRCLTSNHQTSND